MSAVWMIYGAYGFTGELAARLAVSRGELPLLAGRDERRVAALAEQLGLDHRVFGLDAPDLSGVDAVLHCAGPFSRTSRPMVDACLAAGVHYLDITGEIDVFEAILGRDAEAREAAVALMPGVGFDVVPTDCLAAMLAERLPGATSLVLAFKAIGKMSPGTARTAVESVDQLCRIRRDGEIRNAPPGSLTRRIPFPRGERECIAIPWGDVSTAWHSTGIPNITVYQAMPARLQRAVRLGGRFAPVLGASPVKAVLSWLASTATGPDAETRARGGAQVWGELSDGDGHVVVGSLTTPDGYALTADSAVRAVQAVRSGRVGPGAWTPSRALGSGFVLECDGVELVSIEPSLGRRHSAWRPRRRSVAQPPPPPPPGAPKGTGPTVSGPIATWVPSPESTMMSL